MKDKTIIAFAGDWISLKLAGFLLSGTVKLAVRNEICVFASDKLRPYFAMVLLVLFID